MAQIDEIKSLLKDEMATTFNQLVERMDKSDKESKAAVSALEAKYLDMNKEMLAVKTAANRPAVAAPEAEVKDAKFYEYVQAVLSNDRKALSIAGGNTAGAYIVPADFSQELITLVPDYDPIAQLANNVISTSTKYQMPKMDATFDAAWVTEVGTKTETTGTTFALEEIPIDGIYAFVDISNVLLNTNKVGLQSAMAKQFAERFAHVEGEAFITGDGSGKPEGLLATGILSHVPSGDASKLTVQGLVDVCMGVKANYARNGSFLMNRKTLGTLFGLANSAGESIIGKDLVNVNGQFQLFGKPVVECPSMPDIAGGAFPVAFGDINKAYTIARYPAGMAMTADSALLWTTGYTRFKAIEYVGGHVVNAEAALKLEIASS